MRVLLFTISLLALAHVGHSQNKTEIGGMYGFSYYLGDLNEYTQFPSQQTFQSWGVLVRQPLNERWAIRGNFYKGTIGGDDALSSNEIAQNRNLSFNSSIWEVACNMEFNFLPFHSFAQSHYISPYIFGGLALFHFNPTGELNGNQYELQPLRTENQSDPYNLTSIAIPFGGGVKFKFTHRFMFGIEWGLRKTFTDYLDDVSTRYPSDPTQLSTVAKGLSNKSLERENGQNAWGMQRGNDKRKDLYSFAGVTMTIRIGGRPELCRYKTR